MSHLISHRFARTIGSRTTGQALAPVFVLLAVLPLFGATARAVVEPISPAWSVDLESTEAPAGATYARVRHLRIQSSATGYVDRSDQPAQVRGVH